KREADTESHRSLKGKCAACGKMVSKSNMTKHCKVYGKKKPPKTHKVINRESYTRHKDKILNKRFEQRLYDRFRGGYENIILSISHRLLFTRPIFKQKAQAVRDEEFIKLEKLVADFESKGPCTPYEEFMESEKHRRTKSPVDDDKTTLCSYQKLRVLINKYEFTRK
ncbi:hypothetical protein JG688_00005161, partial [Phytophthora aleatoria]